MKKCWIRCMSGILVIVLIISVIAPSDVVAATKKKNITLQQYVKLLVTQMNLPVDTTIKNPYICAAVAGGILITADEFSNYEKTMTRAQCALLTNRADEKLNGTNYDKELYKQIVDLKRISDLSEMNEKYQDAVVKVFEKGIIVGYSNGQYTHDREFRGSKTITESGAKAIVKKVLNKKERHALSPDGQLIRTTNLPVNAKEYEYILASFPNKFYEMKFEYELSTYTLNYKFDESDIFCTPKNFNKKKRYCYGDYIDVDEDIKKYRIEWSEKIKNYLEITLNFNYKTVDTAWMKALAETFYAMGEEEYNDIYSDIKQDIKSMKKNKVIIECDTVSVEPSTLYYQSGSGSCMRAYVRYRIVSAESLDEPVFYPNGYCEKAKIGQWRDWYYDIELSSGYNFVAEKMGISISNRYVDKINVRKTKVLKFVKDKETGKYSFQ